MQYSSSIFLDRGGLHPHAFSVFFTLALANRTSTLLINEVARLRQAYMTVQHRHAFETIAIVVLPDHLHAIWTLPAEEGNYAIRWQQIKREFSKGLPPASERTIRKIRKREKGIWQRRYWEHRIHDEDDLSRHIHCLHYNRVKHGLVRQVQNWPYSSFHRYVEQGVWPKDWAGTLEEQRGFGE